MSQVPSRSSSSVAAWPAAKAAVALREPGYAGPVTLIADEADAPYERPPLSKGYLAGEAEFEDALVRPPAGTPSTMSTCGCSTAATSIDRAAHTVAARRRHDAALRQAAAGDRRASRRLSVPGADAAGVLLPAHAMPTPTRSARRSAPGAGWSSSVPAGSGSRSRPPPRDAGTEVTIVEMAALPLLGVLGPEIAQVFADLHTEHGVELRLGAKLDRIEADGDAGHRRPARRRHRAPGRCRRGRRRRHPDVALAQAAGLAVDNGVLVDASLRTSDPDVYAVGDIANHEHPTLGTRVRVEHWATALNQPRRRRRRDARRRRRLRRTAVLLQRPVRPRDGVPRSRAPRRRRPGRRPRRPGAARIRGVLAGRREPHPGAHERQRLGRRSTSSNRSSSTAVVDPARLADPDVPWAELG